MRHFGTPLKFTLKMKHVERWFEGVCHDTDNAILVVFLEKEERGDAALAEFLLVRFAELDDLMV